MSRILQYATLMALNACIIAGVCAFVVKPAVAGGNVEYLADEFGKLTEEDGEKFSKKLAIANAIAGLGSVEGSGGKFAVSLGVGEANATAAFAVGASFGVRENMTIKFAMGTDQELETYRANLGLSVQF